MKQKILDKHNENNKFISEADLKLQTSSGFRENIVKVVDKSYLEKSFIVGTYKKKLMTWF